MANNDSTLFRRPSCEKVAPSGQFEIRRSSSSVPSMTDGLSTLYQDLLSGSYDCVDRIVLNAGLRAMTALLVLRDKAIKPLLAAAQPLRPRRGPHNPKPIDLHY